MRRVIVLLIVLALMLSSTLLAQEGSRDITVDLTAYEGNPIIEVSSDDAWDSGHIWNAAVVVHDDLFHMFYTGGRPGFSDGIVSVGYATSADGMVWEKHEGNPVFEADGEGFDEEFVGEVVALVEDDTWVLYYFGKSIARTIHGSIGRATATDPTGPWTTEENPVLEPGGQEEWDYPGVIPASVIVTDEGYVMYYIGGEFGAETPGIGMATSEDGIEWIKYDDPTTTDPPFAESDPVLQPGIEGWESKNTLWGAGVHQTADGWEMFFSEKCRAEGERNGYRIGYATSDDGIHWTKHPDFPVLAFDDDPATPSVPDLYVGTVIANDSGYFVYYSYHWAMNGGISMATGAVTNE